MISFDLEVRDDMRREKIFIQKIKMNSLFLIFIFQALISNFRYAIYNLLCVIWKYKIINPPPPPLFHNFLFSNNLRLFSKYNFYSSEDFMMIAGIKVNIQK